MIQSLRADKVAIITQTMQFTDQQSAIFWPIYRNYENDLSKLNDDKVSLIKSYAQKYQTLIHRRGRKKYGGPVFFD